jgi:hypothetical protein
MDPLAERFDQRLRESIPKCIALGYHPTVFIDMLERYDGVQLAKRLIAASEIQSGLTRLATLGRLDLSMEYMMLEPEFASLFTKGELDAARWRLGQLR